MPNAWVRLRAAAAGRGIVPPKGEIFMIRMTQRIGIIALACLALIGAAWAAEAEKPLDNAEIIKLTKADMGDAVIIAKIKGAASVNFATGTDDLVKLKQ